MKNPKLITKPFAQNGQKNAIPENYSSSMESNQATWDQGFGQITMIPVAAGGLPPKGQDFNGIFNQISENVVYLSKGGRFKFSADYAAAINGYPKGAILQSDDEKKEYQSLVDNNKVNFNTATQAQINAAWKLFSTDDMLQQLAGKQPAGDYASSDYFYKTSNYAGMRPGTSSYIAMLYDDGRFAVWGEKESAFLWRFNNKGEMTEGLISLSCGGTGGSSADSARTNLSIYSKAEVDAFLATKQQKGSYANGTCFYDTSTLVGMRTRSTKFSYVVNEDGSSGVWDETNQKFTVRFNSVGALISGSVPAVMVTGLAEIGVGQKWKIFTNQRSLNSVYTNSTSKPILVSVICERQTEASTTELWVGGVVASSYYKGYQTGSDASISAIVPAGETYTVKGDGWVRNWSELS